MNNQALFAQAQAVIPGGVNSPVRAFKSVGGTPIFIRTAKGAMMTAEDGQQYIDYVGSWGPMILGHGNDAVIEAVREQALLGLSFGAPTVHETTMANLVTDKLAWVDQVRMVNSGTEATMSAIRLARGITNRDKLLKFEGCYHGHADSLLVKAGSGALTLGVPNSPGVPAAVAENTLTAQFNDIASVQTVFDEVGDDIAAIIVEPVAGNMNCVPPQAGFLEGLREICDRYGALLIMDEVMTGFRVGPDGAQGLFQVQGDITCLGKIIGGGMPVGAFAGSKEVMSALAPSGPVYQAGTLSGNPVAMAAGIATLSQITPELFDALNNKVDYLLDGLHAAAKRHDIGLVSNRAGAMFGLFFTDKNAINNFQDVMSCDATRFSAFFQGMLEQGVYLAPSAFEAGFLSICHDEDLLNKTIAAAEKVFAQL